MEETIKAASDLLLNSDSQKEEERKQKEEERKRKEKAKQESRWYVNLIINKEVTRKIITRDKIIQYVRKFLVGHHFLEVATPMMNIITGRATDRSFMTYDTDLIKLLVGGFQHVYAIRNQFRKKKIRLTHRSEFTICESYMSYNDYNDMMELTEKMLSGMVKELTGGYKVYYHSNGLDSDPIEIDFTPPFRRIDVIGELEKIANLYIPNDCSSDATNKYLREVCQKFEIKCPPSETTTRLLDKLVGHLLEDTCVNPTFIIDHPEIMSPLAKYHRSKPGLSERFELFVNKLEVCNGCTVLNDPFEQRKRFAEQRKGRHSGDDEAMTLEEKLCTALEYALPPSGGWGMGIDRFAMLLTDSQNIKEVLLFPAMKP